jgi:hypothetical protein
MFIPAMLLSAATVVVAQSCSMSCGSKGGSCGAGCVCGYIAGTCSAEPPDNEVTVVQCPTKHACLASQKGSGASDPNFCWEPTYPRTGTCVASPSQFNGTSRSVRYECVGTHYGFGNVTITDCITGNTVTVPNSGSSTHCLLQEGQWNRYGCFWEPSQ